MPKYLNSPETTLFLISEKRCLTLIKPEKEIRKENTVLLFLKDSWMLSAAWQSGVKSGVASMGD